MRVAIMQPYIFPYWPYVQLMGCVDLFIILDTVQYIDRGWINRNRICLGGKAHLISFPVEEAERRKPISQIKFSATLPHSLGKIRKTINHGYAKRPFGSQALDLFDATFSDIHDLGATAIIMRCLEEIRGRLSLRCAMQLASDLGPRCDPGAQGYLIELARSVGATTYVNPIGGLSLYEKAAFGAHGIELAFLRGRAAPYDQGCRDFVPDLSSLDLLANVGPDGRRERLLQFDLV